MIKLLLSCLNPVPVIFWKTNFVGSFYKIPVFTSVFLNSKVGFKSLQPITGINPLVFLLDKIVIYFGFFATCFTQVSVHYWSK